MLAQQLHGGSVPCDTGEGLGGLGKLGPVSWCSIWVTARDGGGGLARLWRALGYPVISDIDNQPACWVGEAGVMLNQLALVWRRG